MMFRKDALLFYQSELFYVVMTLLCITLIPILGVGLSLLCALPVAALMLVNPKLHNEFVVINEVGISCQKAGTQLWSHEWDSIACLRKRSRFLMPSIDVITYDQHGKTEQFAASNHYFQLSSTAKKALKQYYESRGTSLYQ